MNRETKEELRVRFIQTVLELAKVSSTAKQVYEEFNVSHTTFYNWKKKYDSEDSADLYKIKPVPHNFPRQIKPDVEQKIQDIRAEYKLGPERIKWYLERYHGITISDSTVYDVRKRHGVNRLSSKTGRRSVHTKRYAKTVPGHHVQVDVKFLIFKDEEGKKVRRFQYTAIDDATRIRPLQIQPKHNQDYAIKFMDYVVEKFPFRISTIRTDRGHEFQARFHWLVEDQGMKHVYIKPGTPQLNGKVERSHRTDQDEFYQLLTYKDDVDLEEKLRAWENFYNFHRPHKSHEGKTPYEVMKCLLT